MPRPPCSQVRFRSATLEFGSGVLATFVGVALGCISPTRVGAAESADGLRFFEEKIRPVLVEQCYGCHSAGAEKIKGQYLLDTREGLRRGGESRMTALVPGDVAGSRFLQSIRWTDPDLKMPPKKSLTAAQIADFELWVKMGAPDPRDEKPTARTRRAMSYEEARDYWAFRPLRAPAVPADGKGPAARTPLDRFVEAKLNSKGLTLSPRAEPQKLLRRAAFALTGLPPEPTEVERLERGGSPEAFDRAVDRLLASPHYGERWARHWLDVARFAESSGFEHDYDRPAAWHYRDYVIRAFNADQPYDEFVRWQLAGDEIAPNDPQALMATGFLGSGVFPTQITANEVERARYDALDDMAATTGAAFLGLSVGCARCHDHKFDPITMRDYYRLVATFTTTVRSEVDLDLDPETNARRLAEWNTAHTAKVAARDQWEREQLNQRFERWLQDPANRPAAQGWVMLDGAEARSSGGATLTLQPDGSWLASGKNPDSDRFTFVARVPFASLTALRIEALPDPSMTKGGPGRADNGNFALSDLTVELRPIGSTNAGSRVKLEQPRADFEQKGLPVAASIDSDAKSGWAVDPEFGKEHVAVFDFAEPLDGAAGVELVINLRFDTNTRHAIGRPRLAVNVGPRPPAKFDTNTVALLRAPGASGRGMAPAIAAWQVAPSDRSPSEREALRDWHRRQDPEWRRLETGIAESLAARPRPILTKVLVATEGLTPVRMHTQGADFFEKTFFLRRGDVNQKQDPAPAGFLTALMHAPETRWQEAPPSGWRTSYRRRALANWMTDLHDGAGALLARVMVNRVWALHFGRGLVATPSDFGLQGEAPSNSELLEWLAVEFVRSGWSVKALHRLILRSAVWQQQTAARANGAEAESLGQSVDPGNVGLWHFPRRRLEAEAIRDHLLAASGNLDTRMGGPGTLDETQRRRAVYFMVKRSQMSRSLQLFDAPDAVLSAGNRPSTITAPQALMFLNSSFVRAQAVEFSRKLLRSADTSPAAVVRAGYRQTAGRLPTPGELADALSFLRLQEETYAAEGLGVAREKAAADLCQVLFGLNEFVYLE